MIVDCLIECRSVRILALVLAVVLGNVKSLLHLANFWRDVVWQVKDVFLPWYNAYRFLVQNVKRLDAEGLEPFKPIDRTILQQSTNVLDRWINSASQSLVAFVRQEMDAYRLYTVT